MSKGVSMEKALGGSADDKTMPLMVRGPAGMRTVLFDEIDRLRNGKTNATNANALARLVSVHIEMANAHQALRLVFGDE